MPDDLLVRVVVDKYPDGLLFDCVNALLFLYCCSTNLWYEPWLAYWDSASSIDILFTLLYNIKFSSVNWSNFYCSCINLFNHSYKMPNLLLKFCHWFPFYAAILLFITDCFLIITKDFSIFYILFSKALISWSFCYDCSFNAMNSTINYLLKFYSVFNFIFSDVSFSISIDN